MANLRFPSRGVPGDAAEDSGSQQEPKRPATLRYLVTLAAASTALWTAMVGPLLVLLPAQAAGIALDGRVGAFTLVAGVGGLVGILANPVAGRLSDRTTSGFGRRRTWIAGGALAGAVALVFLGRADSVGALLAGWVAFQVCAGAVLAGLSATIPDRVPAARRGAAAACLGVSWALAPVLGTLVAAVADDQPQVAYTVLALFLVLACGVFVVAAPDPPVVRVGHLPAPRWRGTFLVDPRRHPDFGYAWLTRFCVALGQNMSVAFLFYFLQDAVRYAERHPGRSTADGMVIVTLVYAVVVIVASVAGGTASDRLGRRKVFVVAATAVFALGTGLGAFYPTWTGVLALAVLTGLGFGVYEATDVALVTQVLPSETDRAKDLGLINMATAIGITLGPVAAAPVLGYGGYVALYVTSGLVVLLGAVFVLPIRAVR